MTNLRGSASIDHPVSAMARWLPWLVAGLAVAVRIAAGSYPVDDAYITFRYARNLSSGLGMVYNPGEPVFGTSTLLFTAHLAILARIFGPDTLPTFALLTSALADGIAIVVLGQLGRRLHLPSGWTAAILLLQALSPLSIRYAISGLETSVVTALLLSTVAAHLARRDTLAAHLAGACVVLRPDGLAVAGVLTLFRLLEDRRIPWATIAILAAWILPMAIGLTALYGSPLPHSITAKGALVYQGSRWINASQFFYHFAGLFLGPAIGLWARGIVILPNRGLTLALGVLAVPQFLLWSLGARNAIRTDRRWRAFVALPVVYIVTYSLLGLFGAIMAEWYIPPLIPFYLLPIVAGARLALMRFTPHAYRAAAATLGVFILVFEVLGLNLGRNPSRPFFAPLSVWDEREQLYRRAASFLQPQLGPGSVVAASEIGALGYYCDCTILDTVGLVSPQALAYYPLPPEASPALNAIPEGLIQDQRPEFVVTLEVFIRETLLDDPWFLEHYDPIWRAETDAFGSNGMLIFRRRPSASAANGMTDDA